MVSEERYTYVLESEDDKINSCYSSAMIKGAKAPPSIIIDNGSHRCRSGFSNYEAPSIIFPNYLGRIKKILDGVPYQLIGNELDQKELYRYYIKSPFDNDVVVNFDMQETTLDYVFYNLNLEDSPKLEFPVIMTETLCNPCYSRKCMLELLFELYKSPSVTFGVDCLFSFNGNFTKSGAVPDDGLIISLSHSCIHIIPRLNGRFQIEKALRLGTGGKSLFMHWNELLVFANPHISGALYQNRIQEVVDKFSVVATDYFDKVNEIYHMSRADPNYGTFIQFPLYACNLETTNRVELSEEEKKARKDHVLMKLYAVHNDNRMRKIVKYRQEIEEYEAKHQDNSEVDEEATRRISILNERIESMQKKYDKVVDVLNGDVSIEEIKVKRKKLSDEEVLTLQNERKIIMERKRKRQKFKEENTGRKKQAMRNRMKIITSLASNEREEKMDKKIRKKLRRQEDNFGAKESDWDIYRSVAMKNGFDIESEEEDNEKLTKIENQLLRAEQPLDPEEEMLMNAKFEDYNKIHLTTEPYRATEGLFRPCMMGMKSVPGIVDGIVKVMNSFSFEEQMRMSQNIYLCGGLMQIPGMLQRIEKELLSIRPYESEFKMHCPDDFNVDAWVGARKWYNSLDKKDEDKHFAKYSDYEEEGIDRVLEKLKEFDFSNIFNES